MHRTVVFVSPSSAIARRPGKVCRRAVSAAVASVGALLFGFMGLFAAVAEANGAEVGWVYWSDLGTDTIERIRPDGSEPSVVLSGLGDPVGIALDPSGGHLYWAEAGGHSIWRSTISGDNSQQLLSTGAGIPYGVAVDSGGGKIYWTEYGGGIFRAGLDGSQIEAFLPTSGAGGLAIDESAQKIYWVDYSAGTVSRANLDASGSETLLSGRSYPNHIILGSAANRLYWTEGISPGRVESANLDGGAPATLVSGELTPTGLALDAASGTLFWALENGTALRRAGTAGDGLANLIDGLGTPLGVAFLPPDLPPTIVELRSPYGELTPDFATNLALDQVTVTFSESIADAIGDVGNDVNISSADFMLLGDGGDGTFETVDCASGAATSDELFALAPNSILNATLELLVYFPGGYLGEGRYRFFGCAGSTLVDADGNGLDGNGDGIAGDDFVLEFQIDQTAPSPPTSLVSLEHAENECSNNPSFTMIWSGATDETGGSGLAGYSYVFEGPSDSGPDAIVDLFHTADPHSYATELTENPSGLWFTLRTCDRAGNCVGLPRPVYLLDITAPGEPESISSSHGGQPISDATVEIFWNAAFDALCGIDGYGILFDHSPAPTCEGTKDVEENVQSHITVPLGDGVWYAHLCARDNAGNWGAAASGGPYAIDTTLPGPISGLTSPTHNSPSTALELALSWDAAVDAGSGIDGYWWQLDDSPASACAGVKLAEESFVSWTSDLLSPGSYYFHICAVDNLGHWGPVVSGGPFVVLDHPDAAQFLFFSDAGLDTIERMRTDGSERTIILSGLPEPWGLAIDESAGKLYWSEGGTSSIRRANIDGTSVETVLVDMEAPPFDLELDLVHQKIYWVSYTSGANVVRRANLDGTNIESVVTGLNAPVGLAVDGPGGKVYWAEEPGNRVARASLDGSNQETLHSTYAPRDVAIDPGHDRLYFTQGGSGGSSIVGAHLDGSEPAIVTSVQGYPVLLTVDHHAGRLYWGDWATGLIERVFANGSLRETLTTGVQPIDIVLSSTSVPPAGNTTVRLVDSLGEGLSGGVVSYYQAGWHPVGTTESDGRVSLTLAPGTYPFRISYGGATVQKSQDTATNPEVLFATRDVAVTLADSAGNPLDPGAADYYASGWKSFGSTAGGIVHRELLPASYPFRISFGGATIQKSQDIAVDAVVAFATRDVIVELRDSTGALFDTGAADYYASGWKPFGSTTGGIVHRELLPASYPFRLSFGGATVQKSQDVGANPVVTFATRDVTVELRDSSGNPLDTGAADYYASGWKPFGSTSAGAVHRELLPASYPFRLSFGGATSQKSQDIGAAPVVVFATRAVTIDFRDSTGNPLDTGVAQYYASGWKSFGSTSGGSAQRELLPATYPFRITYVGATVQKSQDIGANGVVAFATGAVISDSATCTSVYSSGWKSFVQGMELLPATYPFRFSAGTPTQESFAVTAGVENHIR